MVLIDLINLYGRDYIDQYNKYVSYTQSYFRGDPMDSEEMYDWYSMLYDLHIPTKGDNSELLAYMKLNQLTWSDLNFRKTVGHFGNGRVDSLFGAVNFVSDNVRKLYR